MNGSMKNLPTGWANTKEMKININDNNKYFFIIFRFNFNPKIKYNTIGPKV